MFTSKTCNIWDPFPEPWIYSLHQGVKAREQREQNAPFLLLGIPGEPGESVSQTWVLAFLADGKNTLVGT